MYIYKYSSLKNVEVRSIFLTLFLHCVIIRQNRQALIQLRKLRNTVFMVRNGLPRSFTSHCIQSVPYNVG